MKFFPSRPYFNYAMYYATYSIKNFYFKGLHNFPEVEDHKLIFTCDTELTPDWKIPRNSPNPEQSLTSLYDLLEKFNIAGTFLVEGQFIEAYPDLVKELAKKHEIGYHGYSHESYGGFWNTSTKEQPKILHANQIETFLREGKNLVYAATGMDPSSFVAPFHLATHRLIKELIKGGWTADGSIYNHIYALDRPFYPGTKLLTEIPFTVGRIPNWRGYHSPILEVAELDLPQAVEDCKTMEFITITCHPWEMTEKRLGILQSLLLSLDFKSMTMKQLVNNPAPQFN